MRRFSPALRLATFALPPGCGTSTTVPTSKYAAPTLYPTFVTESQLRL